MDQRFKPDVYKSFRILVIGRANAGKTTLLKRVCNTTEDPCIYDRNGNLFADRLNCQRGVHDINRAFSFRSNPRFIFHDSAGVEAGDESQLKEVQDFIAERSKSTRINDQLHAIWFCLKPDTSRPLLEFEKNFFNKERTGKIPVIAIIMMFDDLITQIYDEDLDDAKNRHEAEKEVQDKFINPLHGYSYPPKACTFMEDLHDDNSNHQNQVKDLIEKTAESLDDIALKMLFISIQQNNLELCIKYALK
ncbi:hypothetical protein BDQ17DRAFT_1238044 [Cyathus striatus]|nr:hypothetical protein BDQ17DRAFT_1238044 [Cyathus striatus]